MQMTVKYIRGTSMKVYKKKKTKGRKTFVTAGA